MTIETTQPNAAVVAATGAPPEPAPTPQADDSRDYTQDLADQLATGAAPDPDEFAASLTEADEPEAEDEKPDETQGEGAPDGQPAAPTATDDAPPVPAKPEEPEEVGIEDLAAKGTKVHERFEKLKANQRATVERLQSQIAEATKAAEFGTTIIQVAEQAKLNPAALANWVHLGARLNLGDPAARAQVAELLGFTDGAPAAKPDPVPPTVNLDAKAEEIYLADFKSQVDAYQMTEAAARSVARKMAAHVLSQPPKTPQPTPAPAAPPAPSAQPAAQPAAPAQDPVIAAVSRDIQALIAEYEAASPGFRTKVLPEVIKRIEESRRKSGGKIPPPTRWVAELTDTVRAIQTERSRKPPKVPGTGLRPAGGGQPAGAGGDFVADIADAVAKGRLDSLE